MIDDHLLISCRSKALFRHQKAGAHIDEIGSCREGAGDAGASGNTASHGNDPVEEAADGGDERERREMTCVTSGTRRDTGETVNADFDGLPGERSEEHTSELQSLMRISYAVFCLKKKTKKSTTDIILSTKIQSKIIKQIHYY